MLLDTLPSQDGPTERNTQPQVATGWRSRNPDCASVVALLLFLCDLELLVTKPHYPSFVSAANQGE